MKKATYAILILFIGFTGAFGSEEIEKSLQSANMGSEFWLTVPPCPESEYSSNTNRIKLFVTSYVSTRVRAEAADGTLFQEIDLPAGITRSIELYPEQAQPFISTYYSNQFANRVYPGSAFRVVADDPIALFVVLSFRTDSEGYLALPTSALGTDYRVSSYSDAAGQYGENVSYPSLAGIVAAFDNTVVRMLPCSEHNTFKPYPSPQADTVTKTLNRGDVWVFSSRGGESDLSGSSIQTNFPVAVITANQCANVPLKNKSCEYITEMESPVVSWGKTYFASKIFGRKFAPVVRIYALQDTTTIYRNGIKVGKIDSAGAAAARNFIELRTSDSDPQSAVFTADKPISVTLYNPGTEEDGLPTPRGDCFQVGLAPYERFTNEILLATPVQTPSEAAISEHYINLIYKKTSSSQIPDDLEIGQMKNGAWAWEKIKYINLKETETFKAPVDGSTWARVLFKVVEGAWRIRSGNPVWAYLYGHMPTGSYGMPATAGMARISMDDYEAPVPTWKTYCMGEIRGEVKDMPEDASRRSNLKWIVYHSSESENYDHFFSQIIPGQTERAEFKLFVRNPKENAKATLTFRDMNGNDTTVTIHYTAPKLVAHPGLLDFGLISKNISYERFVQLVNESDSLINIPNVALWRGDRGFVITTPPENISLKPGDSCRVGISFNTLEGGEFIDSLGVGDDCFFANLVELRAHTGEQIIKADDAQFGEVTIGQSDLAVANVANQGNAELIITGVRFNADAAFTSDIPKNVSASNPIVIPAHGAIAYNITFAPAKRGEYLDSIVFSSNARHIDSVIILSARGVSPGLASNSPVWNRCRINREKFPAGPYPPSGDSRGIKLLNNGTVDVAISGVEIESYSTPDGSPAAFIFDMNAFKDLTIKPGADTLITVKFNPTATGEYSVLIKYQGDSPEPARTRLYGVGVVPRIKTSIEKFDTTLANSSLMSYRALRITNPSLAEWEYGDTLTIYSLSAAIPGDISTKWDNFGSKGFKIDLSAFQFPIKLKPGESVEAPVAFAPRESGNIQSELVINSDAENEGRALLAGFGVGDEITAVGDTAEDCPGNVDTLYCEIKNHGERNIELSRLEFNPPYEEFAFADSSIANGFVLPAQTSRAIPILFKPGKFSYVQSQISFKDKSFPQVTASAPITGKGLFAGRETLLRPIRQNVNAGVDANLTLALEPGKDIEYANVKNVIVELSHNSDFLAFDEGSLEINEEISQRFIAQILEFKPNFAKIRLTGIGDARINTQSILLKLGLKTFLPSGDESTGNVRAKIINPDNACAEFEGAQSEININAVCGGELRKIVISPYDYSFGARTVKGAIEVDYELGLAAGTKIEVFSAAGERAAVLLDEVRPAGTHKLNYDASSLGSGIYFIVISSGPFKEAVKVGVIK